MLGLPGSAVARPAGTSAPPWPVPAGVAGEGARCWGASGPRTRSLHRPADVSCLATSAWSSWRPSRLSPTLRGPAARCGLERIPSTIAARSHWLGYVGPTLAPYNEPTGDLVGRVRPLVRALRAAPCVPLPRCGFSCGVEPERTGSGYARTELVRRHRPPSPDSEARDEKNC